MVKKISIFFSSIINHVVMGKRKFVSLYPIYGFWSSINQISHNIFSLAVFYRLDYKINTAYTYNEPKIPIRVEIHTKGFNIDSWLGKKEILQIRGKFGLDVFNERMERGDLLFAAYSNMKFVGFCWLEFPPITDAGYELADNEAYVYDAWTFKKYRGNGVLSAILKEIESFICNNRPEINNTVSHIATWNRASIRGFLKSGYHIVRQEQTIVLFGFHKKIRINKNPKTI